MPNPLSFRYQTHMTYIYRYMYDGCPPRIKAWDIIFHTGIRRWNYILYLFDNTRHCMHVIYLCISAVLYFSFPCLYFLYSCNYCTYVLHIIVLCAYEHLQILNNYCIVVCIYRYTRCVYLSIHTMCAPVTVYIM